MNQTQRLAVTMRMRELQEQIGKLTEDLVTESPDPVLLSSANALHDKSAELLELVLDAVKPSGAYAFKGAGDFVVIDPVEAGSDRDKQNQQLSERFAKLGSEIGDDLAKGAA